jgi:hypothetical protein
MREDWVGSEVGPDAVKKRKTFLPLPEIELVLFISQPVTTTAELSRLS